MRVFNFISVPKFIGFVREERPGLDLSLKNPPVINCKVFVSSNLKATLTCPNCGKSRRQNVSRFFNHEPQIKLKCSCSCQDSFSVILERRRSARKEKFFYGHMVEVHIQGYVINKSIKSKIIVKNLSLHGIRIKTLKKISLKVEERIEIEFKLDDPNGSIISREIRIKKIISPVDIGCEFISDDHYGYLDRYFRSYF